MGKLNMANDNVPEPYQTGLYFWLGDEDEIEVDDDIDFDEE